MVKLKSDPRLCNLTEIALQTHLFKEQQVGCDSFSVLQQGQKASKTICDYVDSLLSTWNPQLPQDGSWQKPKFRPCSRQYDKLSSNEMESHYIDLLNTVQTHALQHQILS